MKNLLLLTTLAIVVSSCTPAPKPINYGSDMCQFCKMTIVDQQHAAELVTKKGKVFKFDAIECMLNYQKENAESDFAFQLVNVYETPKELFPAKDCHFLISKAIPSPMGAYLTAFKSDAEAKEVQAEKGGDLFSWDSLKQFNNSKGLKQF